MLTKQSLSSLKMLQTPNAAGGTHKSLSPSSPSSSSLTVTVPQRPHTPISDEINSWMATVRRITLRTDAYMHNYLLRLPQGHSNKPNSASPAAQLSQATLQTLESYCSKALNNPPSSVSKPMGTPMSTSSSVASSRQSSVRGPRFSSTSTAVNLNAHKGGDNNTYGNNFVSVQHF